MAKISEKDRKRIISEYMSEKGKQSHKKSPIPYEERVRRGKNGAKKRWNK